MSNIAFLGMGAMGTRIATHLLAARYSLHVWNRTPERCKPLVDQGATAYASPKEAAQAAEVVIAMVADDQASRQVWLDETNGAIYGLKGRAIALEYSTLTPGWSHELAGKMAALNHPFLAAPVVGSRPQAEAGKLIQLVGGDAATLATVQPILESHSGVIHHVGDAAVSMALKLSINTLFGIQVAALGEILGMLQKAGMSTETAINWLSQMPTTSPALKGIGALIAAQNHAPLFPIDLVEKDFCYAQEFAQSLEANVPAIEAVQKIYQQAQKSGYGTKNIAGVAMLYS
ncbi:MAG: NAD(P)-dependent oxidoreductase [Leptolyngbya sp. SIO3F4]|nr:NAD(P)-dependent oxidoreductase [Leptolyngbya sp. SIO3F4]